MNYLRAVLCAVIVTVVGWTACADVITGIYEGRGEASGQDLFLLETGHAIYGDGGSFRGQMVGTWKKAEIESAPCIVLSLAAYDITREQVEVSAMCLRVADGRLEVLSTSETSSNALTQAVDAIRHQKAPLTVLERSTRKLDEKKVSEAEVYVAIKLKCTREAHPVGEGAWRLWRIADRVPRTSV